MIWRVRSSWQQVVVLVGVGVAVSGCGDPASTPESAAQGGASGATVPNTSAAAVAPTEMAAMAPAPAEVAPSLASPVMAPASSSPRPPPPPPLSTGVSSVDEPSAATVPAPAEVTPPEPPAAVMLGPDGYPMECVEDIALPQDALGRAAVELSLGLGDAPFVFGEENVLADAARILPTNLRFYLSQFQLIQGQTRTAALPVSETGEALPYGVHLVNAEDPASLRFQLAAPPGAYEGVRFLVGLAEGCNSVFSPLAPPLDQASQMKWPHTFGFLFLRFEGKLAEGSESDIAELIHMGRAAGDSGFAPAFELASPVTFGADAGGLALRVDVAEILHAASFPTDLSDFELPPPAPPIGEEMFAGERLRRNEPQVRIFHAQ